jgi:hypothetical protein
MKALYGSTAVFPTRTNIHPSSPQDNEYYEDGLHYLVMRDGNKLRVVSGWGNEPDVGWRVGTQHELHHDQAGYRFGLFTVIGWFRGVNGDIRVGTIPERKMSLSVFK